MYIQGVSTLKVMKITEQLCGFEVSSTQISRLTSEMDAEIDRWRNRPLESFKYLMLDARYEKVRDNGNIVDMAVLWAIGIDSTGMRSILGISVSLSEAEVHLDFGGKTAKLKKSKLKLVKSSLIVPS